MPFSLDFDHISGRFISIGAFLLKPIAESFERLGQWLRARVTQVDKLDEASRGFPVIAFYNEGITLWVHEIQKGALSPDGNPPGFLDSMKRASQAFVDGINRIPEAVENDLLLLRLFESLKTAVKAIESSLDRFETPTPQMFDPRLRKASDLFGEAALAWRALNSSREQILETLFLQISPAYLMLKGEKAEGGEYPNSTSDLLDRVSRHIVGALLLVIAISVFVSQFSEVLVFAMKSYVLERLGEVGEKIFGLRRNLIDKLYVNLRDSINLALAFLQVASAAITGQISYWGGFIHFYGRLLFTELGWALFQLSGFIHDVLNWIADIFISNQETILKLKKWLPEGLAAAFLAGPIAAELDPLDISGIQGRLDAVSEIDSILAAGPGPPHRSTRPSAVLPPFPNIADQFFGVASAADAARKFANIATILPEQLSAISDAASAALMNSALKFDSEEAAAAQVDSLAEYSRIAKQAAGYAERLFGPDAQILRKRIAGDPSAQLASSFAQWFAFGGFETLAKSLEGYIREMLDTFRKQEEAGEDVTVHITKTSPAILAKKAVLGRAVVQKITVNAQGRPLNDDLVNEIAEGFHEKVIDAYCQGRRLILDVAASGNP